MATILAVLQALISLPETINRLIGAVESISLRVDQLRMEKVEKELTQFKVEVRQTLKQIENAKTNEERLKLAAELNARVGR